MLWNVRGLLIFSSIALSASACQLKLARDFSASGSGSGSSSTGGSLTVSAVSPSQGPYSGNTTITITGTAFVTGATVTIGSSACGSVSVVSATQITCVTPAGTVGWQSVTVTLPNGQNASVSNAFAYEADLAPVGASFIVSAGSALSTSSAGIGMQAIESVGVPLGPIHQTSADVQSLYGPQGVFYEF